MTISRIPAKVSCQSLVGVGWAEWPEKPLSFGNYFHFSIGSDHWPEKYCVNMWSENLKAWANGVGAEDVEVAIFDNGTMRQAKDGTSYREPAFVYVTDSRIPCEWLIPQTSYQGDGHGGLVFTGCGWCSQTTRDEILAFHRARLDKSLKIIG